MLFTSLMCMYCLLNGAMVECQGCFHVIRIREQMDGMACYLYAQLIFYLFLSLIVLKIALDVMILDRWVWCFFYYI